ncbi:MAG: hypothetical protein PWQ82_210 [Thermosediminibacterales bacterium]|nr:hypothetical protein [Thermosediminibacterales bacterium]MDK2835232.1 hypothetical protein [Thermosediminibacterales bacterium]
MKKVFPFISAFLFGIILGAAGLNLFIAKKIDSLYLERESMLFKISEQETRLEKLEKSLAERWKRHVKEIIVFPDTQNNNSHVKIKIKQKVAELLKDLIGEEIDKIDPLLIYNIVNDRKLTIEGKDYLLKVEVIVMDTQMELFLKVFLEEKIPEP